MYIDCHPTPTLNNADPKKCKSRPEKGLIRGLNPATQGQMISFHVVNTELLNVFLLNDVDVLIHSQWQNW